MLRAPQEGTCAVNVCYCLLELVVYYLAVVIVVTSGMCSVPVTLSSSILARASASTLTYDLIQLVRKVDVIVHEAAQSGVRTSWG